MPSISLQTRLTFLTSSLFVQSLDTVCDFHLSTVHAVDAESDQQQPMSPYNSTVTKTGPHHKLLPDHSLPEGQIYRHAPHARNDDEALMEVASRMYSLSSPWRPTGPLLMPDRIYANVLARSVSSDRWIVRKVVYDPKTCVLRNEMHAMKLLEGLP